jgi:acyl-CoA synthetase (AMP-forming)/AMP-acid ligase II
MISHQNVISTVLQTFTFDQPNRAGLARQKGVAEYRETALGLLPFSHSYGLMVIATLSAYRGDAVVVLPKFELRTLLSAIESYKITSLYMVRKTESYFTQQLMRPGPSPGDLAQEQQSGLRRIRLGERRLSHHSCCPTGV